MFLFFSFIAQIIIGYLIYRVVSNRVETAIESKAIKKEMEGLVVSLNSYADRNLSFMEKRIEEMSLLLEQMKEERNLFEKKILLSEKVKSSKRVEKEELAEPMVRVSPRNETKNEFTELTESEQMSIVNHLIKSEKETFEKLGIIEQVEYLVARSSSDREISQKLGISLSEVKYYKHMAQANETSNRN